MERLGCVRCYVNISGGCRPGVEQWLFGILNLKYLLFTCAKGEKFMRFALIFNAVNFLPFGKQMAGSARFVRAQKANICAIRKPGCGPIGLHLIAA